MDKKKAKDLRKKLDSKIIKLIAPKGMSVAEYKIQCNLNGIDATLENGMFLHWVMTAYDGEETNVEGKVHDGADGSNWFTLTNSVINNMYSNNNYFYEDGDHCLIRNGDVRKTIVSQVAGFYIYKEEIIPYTNNEKLCKKVLDILKSNKSINEFKTKSLITLLTHVNDDLIAQSVINYILVRKDSKELALMGIELLNKGIEKKWEDDALKCFMSYADSSSYSLIYKANPKLFKDIQTLTLINPDYLTAKHKKEVEEYKKDKQAKLDAIKSIIGEITTSGIREKMKQLKASEQTKRFTKLANKYIGHSKFNYEGATPKELKRVW